MNTTQNRLNSLAEQVSQHTPDSINITDAVYEGPELVIYTTTPEEFASQTNLIQEIAVELQKQITIRPDPEIRKPESEAETLITETAPEQAGIANIEFHDETSEVFIEAQRPGMVIGRNGETLRDITAEIGWDAHVLRTPPLESETVKNARNFLTQQREERREILQRVGRQIHREPTANETFTRVTTLGCCQEVGRAAFVLSTGESRILIDCGDKPGSDDVPYLQVPEGIAADAHKLDAVVLTHAHIDHCALIPLLYRYGYDGPIYTTQPTRDLMGLLTLDYLSVARKQGRTPPYESEHVREALKHTITLSYNQMTEIAPDTRITFQNAGHILGSAVTHFQIRKGEDSVVFSGDIHKEDTKLFNGAENTFHGGANSLIMESTYGQRSDTQRDQDAAEKQLRQIVNNTVEKGGKVVIPAFAVGRSQEIMLVLEEAMANGDIPEVPIHLDGMIYEATAIHTNYPEYLRDEVRNRIFHEDENPFLHDSFNHIGGEDERQRVKDSGPSIILTTSGMLTGGPIMSWLRHLAPDPDSTLAFVGYQASGTLGRKIQRGERELQLDSWNDRHQNQPVPLNMNVETVEGFSGHADRDGLMDFVETMDPQPDRVLCVHGDPESVDQFSSGIYHDLGIRSHAPKNLETFRFD